MQTAQLNVRLDPALKASGDAAAGRCGWTPTQLVRSLWEYLAIHGEPPKGLVPRLEQDAFDERLERGTPAAAQPEGRELVDGFFDRFGYPHPLVQELDYAALRTAGAREQYEDWGIA